MQRLEFSCVVRYIYIYIYIYIVMHQRVNSLRDVQAGCGNYESSYSIDIFVLPLREKLPGSEFYHSSPSNSEPKNEWRYSFAPYIYIYMPSRTNIRLSCTITMYIKQAIAAILIPVQCFLYYLKIDQKLHNYIKHNNYE